MSLQEEDTMDSSKVDKDMIPYLKTDAISTVSALRQAGIDLMNCQDYETMNTVFCTTVISLRKVLVEFLNSINVYTVESGTFINNVSELMVGLVMYYSACIKRMTDFIKTIEGFEYPFGLTAFNRPEFTGPTASIFTIANRISENPTILVNFQKHFWMLKTLSDDKQYQDNIGIVCEYLPHVHYIMSTWQDYIDRNIKSRNVNPIPSDNGEIKTKEKRTRVSLIEERRPVTPGYSKTLYDSDL